MQTTMKFAGFGAAMRSLLLSTILSIPLAQFVQAGEFSNIVTSAVPQTAEASRVASAAALQGLQKILAALEQSELRKIEGRKENLMAAAGVLGDAANQMRKIEIPKGIRLDYKIEPADRGLLDFVVQSRLNRELPKTAAELYDVFILVTDRLAITVKEASESRDEVLGEDVIYQTSLYLSLGRVVSRISLKAFE